MNSQRRRKDDTSEPDKRIPQGTIWRMLIEIGELFSRMEGRTWQARKRAGQGRYLQGAEPPKHVLPEAKTFFLGLTSSNASGSPPSLHEIARRNFCEDLFF
jgi:hypothetical protein